MSDTVELYVDLFTLERISEEYARLLRLAVEDPERAFPQIQIFEYCHQKVFPGNTFLPRFLDFLSLSGIAATSCSASGAEANDALLRQCEIALVAYSRVRDVASPKSEEYSCGDFTIARSRSNGSQGAEAMTPGGGKRVTDLEDLLESPLPAKARLEAVSMFVESAVPGRVSEIIGELKLKYLAMADRLMLEPGFNNQLRTLGISSDCVGDIVVSASFPIRSAYLSWSYGQLAVGLLDHPDPLSTEPRPEIKSFEMFSFSENGFTKI